MQAGDIFTIDQDTLNAMEDGGYSIVWKDKAKTIHALEAGTQFRITTKGLEGLPVEVRAAKIDPVTNKCGKGRPRRFPSAPIYSLLGETAPDPSKVIEDLSVAPTAPVVAVVPSPTEVIDGQTTTDFEPLAQDKPEPIVESEETSPEELARLERIGLLLGLTPEKASDDDW